MVTGPIALALASLLALPALAATPAVPRALSSAAHGPFPRVELRAGE
jgi:hypothetical protein